MELVGGIFGASYGLEGSAQVDNAMHDNACT